MVDNLKNIKDEIKHLFEFHFLVPRDFNIIAVSKNHTAEKIIPLLDDGHRIFGENKVQEALGKWVDLKKKYANIELHLIGSLQRNKVKEALGIFDVFQTIDRISLVDEFLKYPDQLDSKKFFIQVNTGNEPQKSGVLKEEFDNLLAYCRDKKFPIIGLMCIPPVDEDPIYHFSYLQSLARINGGLKVSAGMSSDYPKAILCGSDYIRIGTALFGSR